jgi:hypothetical protein
LPPSASRSQNHPQAAGRLQPAKLGPPLSPTASGLRNLAHPDEISFSYCRTPPDNGWVVWCFSGELASSNSGFRSRRYFQFVACLAFQHGLGALPWSQPC